MFRACLFDLKSDFSSMHSAPIDLQTVRKLFSTTDRIADSGFLRREISARMKEKLELVKISPKRLLDAGCGVGEDVAQLAVHYPFSDVVGLDCSEAALQRLQNAQTKTSNTVHRLLKKLTGRFSTLSSNVDFNAAAVCGDFSQIPLASNSVDVIWSNLALHWYMAPDVVFAEWRRVLSADGLLMFSCFGPDTLIELRHAFVGIDNFPHTLAFVDMHDLGDMLVQVGMATPVMDMEKITLTYQDPIKLLDDIRALGGNPLATRRKGLMGKNAYKNLLKNISQQRNSNGEISLTFEIIYGHAFKPVSRNLATGESIIRLDFPKKT